MLAPPFQMAIKELAMLAVFSFLVMDQIVPFGSWTSASIHSSIVPAGADLDSSLIADWAMVLPS